MSAEFPVTNGGLAEALLAVHNAAMSEGHARTYNGSAATPMDVACIVAASFSALAAQLQEGNQAHPQTVVPIPASADMAHAMETIGYAYLRDNAPERLRHDVLTIPRGLLGELEFWLEGALTCKAFVWDGDQHIAAMDALLRLKHHLEKPLAVSEPPVEVKIEVT
jgi:hypothetical protein